MGFQVGDKAVVHGLVRDTHRNGLVVEVLSELMIFRDGHVWYQIDAIPDFGFSRCICKPENLRPINDDDDKASWDEAHKIIKLLQANRPVTV